MNKTAHSKEERRVERTPAWINAAWLYMLKIMETIGLWIVVLRHMIGDRRKFVLLSKKEGNVSFGSGSGRIAGKGTMTLINGKGKARDALLVDGIKHNLLSVSETYDQGHRVVFSTKDYEIRNFASGELVAKGVRTSDNIYILNKIQENKFYLSQTDESWLWHKQLGHTSFENLININKIKVVRDISRLFKPNQGVCGPCQNGK